MSDLNLWFIIEIFSFYGYILSAMIFMFEHTVRSTLGYLDKCYIKDSYKYDVLAYFRQDTDWYAFITILSLVNVALMVMDMTVLNDERTKYNRPL